MKLGQAIGELRQERGMTQEQLAFEAGTNAGYISRIERSKGLPSIPLLEKICVALGTSPAALFAVTESGKVGVKPPAELQDAVDADYTPDARQLRRLFRELTPNNRRLTVEFVKLLDRMHKSAASGG